MCMGHVVIQCEYCPFIPVWQRRWYWNEAYTIKRRQPGPGYSSAVGLGPPKLCDESTLLVSRRRRTWRRYTLVKGNNGGHVCTGRKGNERNDTAMLFQSRTCSKWVMGCGRRRHNAVPCRGLHSLFRFDDADVHVSAAVCGTALPYDVLRVMCHHVVSCSFDLAQVSVVDLSAANIASSCHLAYTILRMP